MLDIVSPLKSLESIFYSKIVTLIDSVVVMWLNQLLAGRIIEVCAALLG
jgi:hypothetical protein